MQLVGATRGFIRRPFIYKGIFQGIYSAFLAILMLIGIIYVSVKELPELLELQDINLFIILFSSIILCGILISWLSTFFAIHKYLRMRTDDLYF